MPLLDYLWMCICPLQICKVLFALLMLHVAYYNEDVWLSTSLEV